MTVSESSQSRAERRAPRNKPVADARLKVDGDRVDVVDISELGTQVLTLSALRPHQRVRVSIGHAGGVSQLRFEASVVWAQYELRPGGGSYYRVGLEFLEPYREALKQFCEQAGATQPQVQDEVVMPTTERRPTLVE